MRQLRKMEIKKLFKGVPKRSVQVQLILEDIQYARNVAGVFRTADAARIEHMHLVGITHRPPFGTELKKASRQKERSVPWTHSEDMEKLIEKLRSQKYWIIALELTDEGTPISEMPQIVAAHPKIAIILGNEVHGVKKSTLALCDQSVFIPMYGRGASLNVGVSAGIALYSF